MFLSPASFLCTLWASVHTCIYCIWFKLEPLFLANLEILAVIISVKFWLPISNVWIKLAGSSNAELHYSGVSESLPNHWVSSQPLAVLCSGGSGQHSCPGGAMFCSWLCYSNVCSSSEILSKKSFSPLLGFWGDAACSSQVCLGEVTVLCEAPALDRLCFKHGLAQSCWEVAATLIPTNLTELFVSPCLLFYTTLKPLWLVSVLTSAPVLIFTILF